MHNRTESFCLGEHEALNSTLEFKGALCSYSGRNVNQERKILIYNFLCTNELDKQTDCFYLFICGDLILLCEQLVYSVLEEKIIVMSLYYYLKLLPKSLLNSNAYLTRTEWHGSMHSKNG